MKKPIPAIEDCIQNKNRRSKRLNGDLPIKRIASDVSSCHALDTTQSSIKPLSRQNEPTSTVKVITMMTGSGDFNFLQGHREFPLASVLHNKKLQIKQLFSQQICILMHTWIVHRLAEQAHFCIPWRCTLHWTGLGGSIHYFSKYIYKYVYVCTYLQLPAVQSYRMGMHIYSYIGSGGFRVAAELSGTPNNRWSSGECSIFRNIYSSQVQCTSRPKINELYK